MTDTISELRNAQAIMEAHITRAVETARTRLADKPCIRNCATLLRATMIAHDADIIDDETQSGILSDIVEYLERFDRP